AVVVRIRDSLRASGLRVWMDLDQMAGNVYAKMAEAVLGSDVVVPCLTAAYEASGNCKRELGFAADQTRQGKKIVPVRLDDGPFTWSALITAGLLYTVVSADAADAVWDATMAALYREICAALPEARVAQLTQDAAEAPAVSSDGAATPAPATQTPQPNIDEPAFDAMLSYK
ncbi:hypothetical protein HK405_008728, partial [Cladochytrium tenue]